MDIRAISSGSQRGNCYLLNDGESSLLIECGVPWIRIQAYIYGSGRAYRPLAACLVSHEHGDHVHKSTVRALLKYGVPLICSPSTYVAVLGFDPYKASRSNPCKVGKWLIQGFPVVHDAAEPWGFLIQNGSDKILYLTDTPYTKYVFPGLTHIMIEANYDRDLLRTNAETGVIHPAQRKRSTQNHMEIQACKRTILANDLTLVREIHLLHLSDRNADADDFKRQIAEATGKAVYVA